MLNHLLAGVVALSSLILFLSGFFLPEVQRKPDLAWSGVALLYALLLFTEGDRTSGGALLGHIASVALVLWFGWQTLLQRRQFTAHEAQTAIPGSFDAWMPFLKEGWGRILVTYGETSAWVQDQLGKGDENTPTMNVSPAPLQTVNDEDWDDDGVPASPAVEAPSVAATESPSPEVTVVEEEVTEAIATPQESASPPAEILVETQTTVEQPPVQESSDTETPPVTESPENSSEVPIETPAVEELPTPDPEPKTAPIPEPETTVTEPSTTKREEASSDSPQPEIVAESISIEEPVRHPTESQVEETIREDDDGSWPPQDPIT